MPGLRRIDRFALIVGAMKSGTTNLFSHLSQHPEICACQMKEPSFFSVDRRFAKGLGYYESLWSWGPGVHRVALEASTGYTRRPHLPNAAERIAASGIQAKFIYVMRHPIDRIESNVRMNLARGWEAFGEGGRIHPNIISNSLYYFQIYEYFKRFPPKEILLLRFEDLVRHPAKTLQQVCEFLKVAPGFQFSISTERVHDGALYAMQSHAVLSPLVLFSSKIGLLKVYSALSDSVRRKIRRLFSSLFSPIAKEPTKLTLSQRREICSVLKEDMKKLQDELGFDTTPWQLGFEDCAPRQGAGVHTGPR